MDSGPLLVRKLKIGDSNALRCSKILLGTNESVTQSVRRIVEEVELSFIAIRDNGTVAAVALVRYRNSLRSSADIEFLFEQGGVIYPSDEELNYLIDRIQYICFIQNNIYKLSITVASSNSIVSKAIMNCGFVQEAVLHAEYLNGIEYEDAGLFYMVAPEYRHYNVCFVPFQRGIVAVYGGDDYISSVSFYRYGEAPADRFTRDAALYIDILDSDGLFLRRSSPEYDIDIAELQYLPQELIKAYIQLKEYFTKRRETFDINVKLIKEPSEFQLKVWNVLKKIPYGATYSYEDVALELTADNIKEARKLTRAVGAACSENPVPIFVPCHRVIGKDGKLVGFAGGVEFKDFLLQHEAFPATLL